MEVILIPKSQLITGGSDLFKCFWIIFKLSKLAEFRSFNAEDLGKLGYYNFIFFKLNGHIRVFEPNYSYEYTCHLDF